MIAYTINWARWDGVDRAEVQYRKLEISAPVGEEGDVTTTYCGGRLEAFAGITTPAAFEALQQAILEGQYAF